MKPIIILASILFIAFVSANSAAAVEQEYGGGIIYGPSAAFIIIAPSGWTLDTESGRRYRLPAVLYPNGSSFDGPLVMYINNIEKKTQKAQTLNEFILEETSRFQKKHPDIKIKNSTPLPISNGNPTVVKEFSGDKWGNFEAVVYIEEDKTFTTFTLTSKTEKDYAQGFIAFKDFVGSYQFITDDIQ